MQERLDQTYCIEANWTLIHIPTTAVVMKQQVVMKLALFSKHITMQVDGICYSFACPLHHHDAMVLQESSMLTMLSVLFVNNDPLKCVTDKAYGHLCPLHTSLALR
jgi:hypothetical protein